MDLWSKVRKQIVSCIAEYKLLEREDRLLVAVSGGKDSTILALMLRDIQKRAPYSFDFDAVLLDQKQPGFNCDAYKSWLAKHDIELKVLTEDTYTIVKDKVTGGKSYCGLCSRLRRGVLYNYAYEHGYNKIALGHHRDDLNETLLMNLFYTGKLSSLPPLLVSDDKRNKVIRPMLHVAENDLQKLIQELDAPLIPCNLCGSQDGLVRQKMKKLMSDMRRESKFVDASMLSAQKNIKLSQLPYTSTRNS